MYVFEVVHDHIQDMLHQQRSITYNSHELLWNIQL